MSVGSRDAVLFVIDGSPSMAARRQFADSTDPEDRVQEYETTPFEVMRRYAKGKIAQRILRDLKTTPCGVTIVGYRKTFNCLTLDLKRNQGKDNYDRDADPYRHMYDVVPLSKALNASMLSQLDILQPGTTEHAADLSSAIMLGIETLDRYGEAKNYDKTLYLLTDGESETNWEDWEAIPQQLKDTKISLVVVGFDFDDESIGFSDPKGKSSFKEENEHMLQTIVEAVDDGDSVVANARRAIESIEQPAVKEVRPQPFGTYLTLGNDEDRPEDALRIKIEVKKAVSPAAIRTMKTFSTKGLERTAGRQDQSQSQSQQSQRTEQRDAQASKVGSSKDLEQKPKELEPRIKAAISNEDSRKLHSSLGKGGLTLERMLQERNLAIPSNADESLMSHRVQRTTEWLYKAPRQPPADANGTHSTTTDGKGKDKDTNGQQAEDDEDRYVLTPVGASAQLVSAYMYGDTPVPLDGLEDGFGELKGDKTGMQIYGFLKRDDVDFDWRYGDVWYVYGQTGELGSQKMLSAFLTGLDETKRVAIVRFVGKTTTRDSRTRVPEPRMGILWPVVYDPNMPDGASTVQYAYWVAMPFAEDVRISKRGTARLFPSLRERVSRKTGKVLTEHDLLPTEKQDAAMSALVDSMTLLTSDPMDTDDVKPEPDDDELVGPPASWLDIRENYFPASHAVDQAIMYRLTHPEGDLPPPSRAIRKYLSPPTFVDERASKATQECIEQFAIKAVPPKAKRMTQKATAVASAALATQIEAELFSRASAVSMTATAQRPKDTETQNGDETAAALSKERGADALKQVKQEPAATQQAPTKVKDEGLSPQRAPPAPEVKAQDHAVLGPEDDDWSEPPTEDEE